MNMRLIYDGKLPSLNEMINSSRRNPYAGNRQKRDTQNQVMWQFKVQIMRLSDQCFQGKANVRITYFEPNMKRDEDGVRSAGDKIILDALKELHVIVDDRPKFCHSVSEVKYDKKNPRIEVEIEGAS
jgi:Holliday junction resolvase RusA-like endonuclease